MNIERVLPRLENAGHQRRRHYLPWYALLTALATNAGFQGLQVVAGGGAHLD